MNLKKIIILVLILCFSLSFISCFEEDDGIDSQAKELNSKGTTLMREATSLMRQGNADGAQASLEEALTCYEQALLIQPDYTKAQQNKKEVLKALGRESEIK